MPPDSQAADAPRPGRLKTPTGRILLVDDERKLLDVLQVILEREGHEVHTTTDGQTALALYEQAPFDLVILDLKMPKMSGIDLLRALKERWPDVIAVVLTAFSTWEPAVEAMRMGAYGYVKKPFDNNDIRALVTRVIERRQIYAKLLGEGVQNPLLAADIVGNSPPINECFEVVRRIAKTDSTVVITGESGTGKDLIARAIHYDSLRAAEPYVTANCAALTESLLESELFGHVKGSFTGAIRDRKGLFEMAHQGTLFLDEIGEMALSIQVKFLRVLENKEIKPVGGTRNIPVDVRIIAATHRDLQALTEQGSFRSDLFWRLDVIRIALPPLRERRTDIPLLAGHFLARYARQIGKDVREIDDEAMDVLVRADWPGNVRELENAIQRAVALAEGDRITRADVLLRATGPPSESDSHTDITLPHDGVDLENRLEHIERKYIVQALEQTDGNLTQAASLLGLSFRSLRYRVKKLGIRRDGS